MTSDWVHLVSTFLTTAGTVGFCLLRIGRVAGQSESRLHSIETVVARQATAMDELHRLTDAIRTDLGQHKVHIATSYVSNERFDVFESKLSIWMHRVDQKLDRLIERRTSNFIDASNSHDLRS